MEVIDVQGLSPDLMGEVLAGKRFPCNAALNFMGKPYLLDMVAQGGSSSDPLAKFKASFASQRQVAGRPFWCRCASMLVAVSQNTEDRACGTFSGGLEW